MIHQTLPATSVKRAELLAAFSYALDITEGQPTGHSLRSCWIGSQIGLTIGLPLREQGELYYSVLLKDLGCSSNAARICELYKTDDLAFKNGYKTVGTSLAATLHFVFSRTARGHRFTERAAAVGNILRNGREIAQEMILSRCTRGADIARMLRFPAAVCDAIYHLDEHWDGSGRPDHLRGDAIPLYSQIALLAQVVDVFHAHAGPQAALDEAARRSGVWFDPGVVTALTSAAAEPNFWDMLTSPVLEARVVRMAPAEEGEAVDDDYLDAIAAAFGQVVDAKSPFTAGHSARVAELTGRIGGKLGVEQARTRWLQRAAFLHDVGKLGVSSSILEKPAQLDDAEWVTMRDHASHTRAILSRIGALADFADIAAAHHERIDGKGYPLGLAEHQISRETRIITICDYYDALTADRPYRKALPIEEALRIIGGEVGSAIDQDCFHALKASI